MYVEELKNEEEWKTFLRASSEGTFYHTLKWRDVLHKTFSLFPLYLTIKDEEDKVVGVCPGFILDSMRMKWYCSLPYSDYGGPLIKRQYIKHASDAMQIFLQSLSSEVGISYAKFRLMDNKWSPIFHPSTNIEKRMGVMEIDLKHTPSDIIWNKIFSGQCRNDIRRVERGGYQVREATSIADLKEFYDLYYRNMKFIGGSPYPYAFLETMWNMLYPENLRISIVEKNEILAGVLDFKNEKELYGYLSGLDRSRHKTRVANFGLVKYLIWKQIKKAEDQGMERVSLGSTPLDSENKYHQIKNGLGGSFYPQKIVWYPLDFKGHLFNKTRGTTISLWKSIRTFLPVHFKGFLESKLSKY